MQIDIQIKNLAQVKAALSLFPTIAAKFMDEAIKKSIFEVQYQAKPLTPVDTGNLRRSYNSIFTPLKGVLQPMASYAFWVEVRDNAVHPVGQAHYMEGGLNAAESQINKYFEDALEQTLRSVAKLS